MYLSSFFNDTATTENYTYWHTLSLHDALPIWPVIMPMNGGRYRKLWKLTASSSMITNSATMRSEEHTSELQPLMRSSYAVFCSKNKNLKPTTVMVCQHDSISYCQILADNE